MTLILIIHVCIKYIRGCCNCCILLIVYWERNALGFHARSYGSRIFLWRLPKNYRWPSFAQLPKKILPQKRPTVLFRFFAHLKFLKRTIHSSSTSTFFNLWRERGEGWRPKKFLLLYGLKVFGLFGGAKAPAVPICISHCTLNLGLEVRSRFFGLIIFYVKDIDTDIETDIVYIL